MAPATLRSPISERPERYTAVSEALKAAELLPKLKRLEPRVVTAEDLQLVHGARYPALADLGTPGALHRRVRGAEGGGVAPEVETARTTCCHSRGFAARPWRPLPCARRSRNARSATPPCPRR